MQLLAKVGMWTNFSEKEVQRSKDRYDRKSKFVALEPGDVVLVRKMPTQANTKFRIGGKMMNMQPISGGKQKTLHRNLLLPLGYKFDENVESNQEIEMVSPLFEFKGNCERVNKPIKVEQVDNLLNKCKILSLISMILQWFPFLNIPPMTLNKMFKIVS